MVIPSPFVYWAQTEDTITLKIDLKNVVDPDLKVLENNIKFTAQGIGAHGLSQYEFTLNLYSSIKSNGADDEITVMRVFDNRVELALKKEKASWWPRLTAQPQKPAWLKINFDLWKSEELQDSDEETRDVMRDYPGMYDRLHKEEMGYRKEDWRKVYLIIYNLFQLIGFTYVLTVISVRYSKLGYDSVTDTYEHVGSAIKFLHLMQILEILHPIFGYVKNGADDEITVMRVFDNRVELALKKEKASWWPRLTAQPQKPAWLKINFDLWKSEELQDSDEETRDVMRDYPGMYDRLHKEEMGYRKEDWRKVYLIIYNLFQLIGFTYVLTVISVRYSKLGYDSVTDTYEHVGSAIKFLHLMQILEILHPIFGYVKGSAFMTFVQVMGRNFVIFAMIEGEPRIQTKPVIFYLYIVWSAVEVIRYPFYITQLYKKEIYLLTWLRYSIWLPLYPLGVLCESVIIVRNIPYFEETQRFTISLPNEWNFAFHLPTFLKLYVFLVAVPGLYFLMSHMQKQRMVKLKPKIIIKKSK